ncbi:hypothetical protein V6N13_121919 [Hibiscus sabdariffa]|uniref:Uncharacterized protein n=1 Tax=Hibiscus sabdariffa TaxID=183260 RepID=A0ABR2NE48_9ROSI
MADEEIGLVTRPMDDRDNSDVMTLDGPRSEIPKVGKAELIEHNGELRRVRQVSEVMIKFLSPKKRLEAKQKLGKRGRGRKTVIDPEHS